jgi:hypothetical protein
VPRVRPATPPRGPTHVPARGPRWAAIRDGIRSTLAATISTARGLSLLASGRPGTPLRALCVAAFDTLHAIRRGKRLSTPELNVLAALLDLGADANAAIDHKTGRRGGRSVSLQLFEAAGIGPSVAEYLRRLGDLEGRRPPPGGDRRHFETVQLYREAVVRLSLGMLAAAAGGDQDLDAAVAATYGRGALSLLFRLAMQCQIIDDVLDYSPDRAAGLPTFLTACRSLPQALELTRQAARGYAGDRRAARVAGAFPLRAALSLVSAVAVSAVSLRARLSHADEACSG